MKSISSETLALFFGEGEYSFSYFLERHNFVAGDWVKDVEGVLEISGDAATHLVIRVEEPYVWVVPAGRFIRKDHGLDRGWYSLNTNTADAVQYEPSIHLNNPDLSVVDQDTIHILPFRKGVAPAAIDKGSLVVKDIKPAIMGEVTNKIFEGGSLVSVDVSTRVLEVTIEASPTFSNGKPTVTVNGRHTALLSGQLPDSDMFIGAIVVTLGVEEQLTIEHEDGATLLVNIVKDSVPKVIDFSLQGYPGTQTEVKPNDKISARVEANTPFEELEIRGTRCTFTSMRWGQALGSTILDITVGVEGGGTSVIPEVRIRGANQVWSEWYRANMTLDYNEEYPVFGPITVKYPEGQEALAHNQIAVLECEVLNTFDTIDYKPDGPYLEVAYPTTYAATKQVTLVTAGMTSLDEFNFVITATKTSNGASSSKSAKVQVADAAPKVSVFLPSEYMRSGGNDGTEVQRHEIIVRSDQTLKRLPTLEAADDGSLNWLEDAFVYKGSYYVRTLLVHDNDKKGTFPWGALVAENLAGKVTTQLTGDSTFTLKGFVSRMVTLGAQQNETTFNVAVSDYANLGIAWEEKNLPDKLPLGTTATPQANAWCIDRLGTNPTLLRILDVSATNACSVESRILIEES